MASCSGSTVALGAALAVGLGGCVGFDFGGGVSAGLVSGGCGGWG
jgi:hypothetical protein